MCLLGYLPLSNLSFPFKCGENTLEGLIFFFPFFSEEGFPSGSPGWTVMMMRNGKGGGEASSAFLSLDDKRSQQKGVLL